MKQGKFKRDIYKHRQLVLAYKPVIPSTAIDYFQACIDTNSNYKTAVIDVFRPKKSSGPYKTIFFVSGTGFVAQETAVTDRILQHLAEKSKFQVIKLNHRLAPEHKCPVIFDDCYNSFCAVIGKYHKKLKVDLDNIVIGGYSTGANLAALMTLKAMKQNLPVKYQLLISPIVDLSRTIKEFESYKKVCNFGEKDKAISKEFVNWFIKLYMKEGISLKNPSISPYWAKNKNISRLPYTDIFTSEFDRFRVDSKAYYDKLLLNKVSVYQHEIKGSDHSYLWNDIKVTISIAKKINLMFGQYSIPRSLVNDVYEEYFQNNKKENPKNLATLYSKI